MDEGLWYGGQRLRNWNRTECDRGYPIDILSGNSPGSIASYAEAEIRNRLLIP